MVPFKKILIRLLAVGMASAILAAAAMTTISYWPQIKNLIWPVEPEELPPRAVFEPRVIDPAVLSERFEAAQNYQPSDAELAEEAAFTAQQMADIKLWLADADPEQRLTGAEQLSAYPSPEAEQLLAETLGKDKDEQVRVAAATSLFYMKTLEPSTQNALINALQDTSEDVRNSALSTLQTWLGRQDATSAPVKRILGLLKKQMKAKRTPADTRQIIKDYLRDQFS